MKLATIVFCVLSVFATVSCGPTTKTECEKSGGWWHCEIEEGVEDCECDIYTDLP